MLSQDMLAARASRLEAFLAERAPAQRAAFLALKFREPRTIDEWRLWFELQAEFARWRQLEDGIAVVPVLDTRHARSSLDARLARSRR